MYENMTIGKFLVGMIGVPLGFVIILYRSHIKTFIGDLAWAEKYLGSGGTWTFITLVGLLVIIFSIMWMFGTIQEFLHGSVKPFFVAPN